MAIIMGGQIGHIEMLFVILKNFYSSYLIQVVLETLPGVTYKSGTRGWMERNIFAQHFWRSVVLFYLLMKE